MLKTGQLIQFGCCGQHKSQPEKYRNLPKLEIQTRYAYITFVWKNEKCPKVPEMARKLDEKMFRHF